MELIPNNWLTLSNAEKEEYSLACAELGFAEAKVIEAEREISQLSTYADWQSIYDTTGVKICEYVDDLYRRRKERDIALDNVKSILARLESLLDI